MKHPCWRYESQSVSGATAQLFLDLRRLCNLLLESIFGLVATVEFQSHLKEQFTRHAAITS
jgi:hypothetical protein